jgi:AraC family transcriptional activator of mtrCDE
MVLLGASTRIGAQPGEIPYHVVLGGSAELEDGTGRPLKRLVSREIVLLPHSGAMSCVTAM